jgi:hypothetical protein
MKTAIMQPYFFPYIGYFQLVNVVDDFVFYDDVNYIKRGWVNRNRILSNSESIYFNMPLSGPSQNQLINEIKVGAIDKKLLKTIEMAYKRAPNYEEVSELVKTVLSTQSDRLVDFCENSIKAVACYLGLNTAFHKSSIEFSDSKGLDKAERLINISKKLNSKVYINASGGKDLYEKEVFIREGIELFFLNTDSDIIYKQFNNDFNPWLSIIDVLMFNSREEVLLFLDKYHLT